jgi:hypothetical protein
MLLINQIKAKINASALWAFRIQAVFKVLLAEEQKSKRREAKKKSRQQLKQQLKVCVQQSQRSIKAEYLRAKFISGRRVACISGSCHALCFCPKENSTSETKCAYQSGPSVARDLLGPCALKIFIPHLCRAARG